LLRARRRPNSRGCTADKIRQRHPAVRDADRDLRICVAEEIVDFGGRIRRIQRHEHGAQTQAGQVQRDRFRRLLDLRHDSIGRVYPPLHERGGDAIDEPRHVAVRQL
jgi:hypothetical protein